MADFLARLREADQALADVAPSAALDARMRRSIASRSAHGDAICRLAPLVEAPGRRGTSALALAVSLGALLVGLRALERRGAPTATPDGERAAVTPALSASVEGSAEPRVAPSPVRRSADRSAPSSNVPSSSAPSSNAMDRRGPDPDGRAPRAPDVRDLAPPSPALDGGAEGPRFEYVPGPSSGTLHFERRGSVDEGGTGFAGEGARASGRGPALRLGSLSGGSPTPQEEGDPSAPDAPPSETNPEPTCEAEVIEPGVCVDITELKTQASEALCADGLFLTAFDIDLGSCGENLATAAKYTCCPPTSSPPPEEKPSETPGPSNCKTLTVETTACTAFSAIDEEAVKQCGTGALVVDHKYYGECPDGAATQGWFTCCPVAEDNQPG